MSSSVLRTITAFFFVGYSGLAMANSSASLLQERAEFQAPKCPVPAVVSPDVDEVKVHNSVSILIGADVLGRIAIAVDYDGDQFPEEEMLFGADVRLSEPEPVFIRDAKLTTTKSWVKVESRDKSLAVALSMQGDGYESPPIPSSWRKFSEVFISDKGMSLAKRVRTPAQLQHFSAYDHNSPQTWYPGFERDALYVGTACAAGCVGCDCTPPPNGCTTGGCGAASCPCASPCSGGSQVCGNGYFACCVCSEDEDDPGTYWCFTGCYGCDLNP